MVRFFEAARVQTNTPGFERAPVLNGGVFVRSVAGSAREDRARLLVEREVRGRMSRRVNGPKLRTWSP